MPDSPRTSAAVVQEYNKLAFKAGNLQYQITEQKRDLNTINETMRSLNLEYAKLKEVEETSAKATPSAETTPEASKDA